MEKVYRVSNANWEIRMENTKCTVKLDGNIVISDIDLEQALIFIRKWHEPITLVDQLMIAFILGATGTSIIGFATWTIVGHFVEKGN